MTGHTGFKGSWLCLWLSSLGARVYGYALPPPTKPGLYEICRIDRLVHSTTGDVRNLKALGRALKASRPEIVIHLAAQPIVRDSYKFPLATYEINVIGTANLLEAVRACGSVKAVVNVTTDKCYENRERRRGYREDEALGGYDPYSSSKACSELVTAAYRQSFFNPSDYRNHGVAVASARAGNVIGGGDWGNDRLIPDCVRAVLGGGKVFVRNPGAVRPWQFVLEPLGGYLLLAMNLYRKGPLYSGAWNFGPDDRDAKPVEWLIRKFCSSWGEGASYEVDKGRHPHEANYLRLDCSKAKRELGWVPRWDLDMTMEQIVRWTKVYAAGGDVKAECLKQIGEFQK